ncbi:MAG: hypothetical protein AB8E82_00545 [Aureispira sp.]
MVNQQQIEASLRPRLEDLETQRVQLVQQVFLTGFLCLTTTLLTIGICYNLFSSLSKSARPELATFFVIICTLFPSALVAFIANQQFLIKKKEAEENFQVLLKTEGFLPVFEEWNRSLKYYPEQIINQIDLNKADILDFYEQIEGDDYCEGVLSDGRAFRFSELETQKLIKNNYKDDYSYTRVFKGLFFVLEDSRPYTHFSGYLKLAPKPLPKEREMFSIKQFFAKTHNDILDADFEMTDIKHPMALLQHFELSNVKKPLLSQTLTTKPEVILAKLAPALQKRLLYLKEALQGQLRVVFDENNCYVTVAHEGEFWKCALFQSLKEARIQQTLAWNFAHCFMILEELAAMTSTRKIS